MKFTINLTTVAAAGAAAWGFTRGPRWLGYLGAAAFAYYSIVYPNWVAPVAAKTARNTSALAPPFYLSGAALGVK